MPIEEVAVEPHWGPAKFSGTSEPDAAERDASWELSVELITRIAVASLQPGHGILREALTSLDQLFNVTRAIPRKYGPRIARAPEKDGQHRFGHLAVWMLNATLQPVLACWHPELERGEVHCPEGHSVVEHEAAWDRAQNLRKELEDLRQLLLQREALAVVCECQPWLMRRAKCLHR